MIRFEVRVAYFENTKTIVYSLVQPKLFDQHLNSTDAAVVSTAISLGDIIMNIARTEHRFEIVRKRFFIQSFTNFTLAMCQFFCYLSIHSKRLLSLKLNVSLFFCLVHYNALKESFRVFF